MRKENKPAHKLSIYKPHPPAILTVNHYRYRYRYSSYSRGYVQWDYRYLSPRRSPAQKNKANACVSKKAKRSNSHGICRALGYGERHGTGFRGLNYPAGLSSVRDRGEHVRE